MIRVTGVRFKTAGKVYYFDPGEYDVKAGDNVIVETARGMEFGYVTMDITEVDESEIIGQLKKIIRVANEEDQKKHIENMRKKEKSLAQCQEKIDKHGLDMKLVDVEYTFDNSKIIFYFTSDGRVDFRELVKDLAAVFKMRIELRQIGVRDEAKMLGGIGSCGRSLCCNSWLADFVPVSIKMAKVQNLSLNPTKISGICGRLMCCLKYENDVYIDLKKGMPEPGERVKTPDGLGKVFDTNIFEGKVRVKLYTDEGPRGKKGEDEGNDDDKLSSDLYTYAKEEIKRIEKHHKKDDIFEGIADDEMKELKKLLND